MSKRARIAIAFAILAATVAFDQLAKQWARAVLHPNEAIGFLGGHLQLVLTENRGAFLSLGAQLAPSVRFAIFTALVGLGLAAGLLWLIRAHTVSLFDVIAVSLLIGGGIGNLIDRATRSGAVTDFLFLRFASLRTGVFNVADMFVTTAAIMLLARSVLHREG